MRTPNMFNIMLGQTFFNPVTVFMLFSHTKAFICRGKLWLQWNYKSVHGETHLTIFFSERRRSTITTSCFYAQDPWQGFDDSSHPLEWGLMASLPTFIGQKTLLFFASDEVEWRSLTYITNKRIIGIHFFRTYAWYRIIVYMLYGIIKHK